MMRAVLFDFNATLIRSRPWIDLEVRDLPRAAFGRLADEEHIAPLDDEQLATVEATFRAARMAAEETFTETSHIDDLTAMVAALGLQERVGLPLIEETVAALHRACVPTVTLEPQVAETLQRIQDTGLRLGIISNAAYSPFLHWTLEHFGLKDFFEEIVVSADENTRKPALDIFKIASERMTFEPGEAVYVGDDFVKDVTASQEYGMRAIWYVPSGDPQPANASLLPDATVRSHAEIPPLVESWT